MNQILWSVIVVVCLRMFRTRFKRRIPKPSRLSGWNLCYHYSRCLSPPCWVGTVVSYFRLPVRYKWVKDGLSKCTPILLNTTDGGRGQYTYTGNQKTIPTTQLVTPLHPSPRKGFPGSKVPSRILSSPRSLSLTLNLESWPESSTFSMDRQAG